MANSAQALKRAKQAEKNRQLNMAARTRLRTKIKRVVYSAEEGNVETTAAAYKEAVPYIDSAVNKGLIHRNKAARLKSRLNARIVKLQQA
ncbi:MAG: 30S ribosomal protein S20 [Cycloclasticus sp.]|nr:MAG: 30S ribosomal protein S20 [Cycloclasticus sp.]